jgi:hypothetical protein
MEGYFVDASSLKQLAEVFSQVADPRKARGVRHPFPAILSLVFLGLLARITEMAVVTRWAAAHWDELKGPLGFTREKPPCDTTISRALAKLSLSDFRRAFSLWLQSVLADREGRWAAAIDGKTCRQGLGADGSPVQMLNVFLQQAKLALAEVFASRTNAALSVLRLIHAAGQPLRAAAEATQWSPLGVLRRLGFIEQS